MTNYKNDKYQHYQERPIKAAQENLFNTNELLISKTDTGLSNKSKNKSQSIVLNCLGVTDFIRQYNSLRFLNPNRTIELTGFIKTPSDYKINYHLKSRNLAVSFINLDYFQINTFAKPEFNSIIELNNFIINLLENETQAMDEAKQTN